MAGRKPLPNNLKILKGTAQNCRMNKNEPRPITDIPDPPEHLGEHAKKEWQRIAPELKTLGLISHIDMAALSGYCQAYHRWIEAEAEIVSGGLLAETVNGMPIANPAVGIANNAMTLMHRFLTEFGMTPSSRSRITASKKDAKENPWAGFEERKAK